jgi:hypothetical protein
MHRLTIRIILFACVLFGLHSCKLFDPPEQLAGYLKLRNARVEIDSVTGQTSNIGLRNVWIYHAGLLQSISSTQDSAVVIPLLSLDRSDFAIDGGVYETGQSAYNVPYPFWKPFNFNAQMQALDTVVAEPVFEYIDQRFYDLMMNEGFEGGSVDLVPFSTALTQSDSTFVRLRNNGDVFHGSGMGFVNFGPNDRYFEGINALPFLLKRGQECYAEITYKSSMPFTVGLVYENVGLGLGSVEIVTVTPSPNWNTIYVHMVTEVRSIVNAGGEDTDFWLWLKNDGKGQDGYIQFDDIRVLQAK